MDKREELVSLTKEMSSMVIESKLMSEDEVNVLKECSKNIANEVSCMSDLQVNILLKFIRNEAKELRKYEVS